MNEFLSSNNLFQTSTTKNNSSDQLLAANSLLCQSCTSCKLNTKEPVESKPVEESQIFISHRWGGSTAALAQSCLDSKKSNCCEGDCKVRVQTIQERVSENYSRRVYDKEDIYEIPDDMLEAIPSDLLYSYENSEDEIPSNIHGTDSLRARLRELMHKYRKVFSREVRNQPANISPFRFNVNKEEWEHVRNRTGRRKYDLTRQDELKKIITKLLHAGVIKASNAAYYSHGFVVPKATRGQWRLVVDYKNLNKVCSTERWPIPTIKEILQRIGDKRPNIFNVMDLTSGYYQAPIAPDNTVHTAFMTPMGLFEWTRLPMGPKGACSFFQKTLATEVFNGLIQDICELYLDDLIVYASTEDECIERLEKVFQRCVEKNITLHPDKCEFGLSEVEYVGHTINGDGIHFTRDKLDSVLNFELPKTQKALFSFLGFVNYFRDHIRNFSILTKPLYTYIRNYNKKKNALIPWTDETIRIFKEVVEAVHTCPRIHFIDQHSEIILNTDASDYGCGAYLYQLKKSAAFPEGEEIPIAFMSKSFDQRMRRWDTPQKEGFAIFFALLKLDYLLRDRQFKIRTDHKNLAILKGESYTTNLKVQRWLTAIQHYDFEIEYVKGPNNEIADALSRLCANITSVNLRSIHVRDDAEHFRQFLEVHNDIIGHSGVAVTQQRLAKANLRWKGMQRDVKRFISLCPICQKNDQRKNRNTAFPFTLNSYTPFEKLQMDFIVGLDPDEYGIRHIMVIIDTCSRWVSLLPMKDLSAINAADAFMAHCGTFGFPKQVSHDQDQIFMSKLMQETMALIGTKSVHSIAYSKEENGIVERANKEVFRHLRNFIFDRAAKRNYSRYIPFVERIINSSSHKLTGFSPAQIIFGNSVDLNRNTILEEHNISTKAVSTSDWVEELSDVQLRILEIARENLKEHDEIHMINYPITQTSFEINSYVLVDYKNAFRRGPRSKLMPFKKGPYQVVSFEKSKYFLKDLISLKIKPYHVKRLTKFNFDATKWNPLQVALRDTGDLFQVERVSAFKGDLTGPKSNLLFKVHWVGYGDEHATYEPWANVRSNMKLHDFLLNHKNKKVRNLLPKLYLPDPVSIIDSESEDDFEN